MTTQQMAAITRRGPRQSLLGSGGSVLGPAGLPVVVVVVDQLVEVMLPSGVAGPIKDCPGAGDQRRCSDGRAEPDRFCGRHRLVESGSKRWADMGTVFSYPDVNRITSFDSWGRRDDAGVFGPGIKPSGRHGDRLA